MTPNIYAHSTMNLVCVTAWPNGRHAGERIQRSWLRLIAALSLAVAHHDVVAQSLPRVHIVGTGGTIGSAGDYWHDRATRLPIDSLVRIPGLEKIATISTEQLWSIGSSSVG